MMSTSCTSSPAARSPKTCANRHSSGCGCDASPSSPGPGGSMAARPSRDCAAGAPHQGRPGSGRGRGRKVPAAAEVLEE
uniref:Uncharacterized protein n=1 Tax=Arundo donax TaxID=35708 RepID=A0A0A9FJC9_ARUDO